MRGAAKAGFLHETPREHSKRLRRDQTDAERMLWARLRDGRLAGAQFRRRHPVGPFIADFCCLAAKLIVEVDGGQHARGRQPDARRSTWLQAQGFRERGK